MIRRLTLSQRLTLVFTAILLLLRRCGMWHPDLQQ